MFCNNCGKELENGAKFCANCGAPQQISNVTEPQPQAQESVTAPVSPVAETQSVVPEYTQPVVTAAPMQETPSAVPQYTAPASANPNPNLQPPVMAKKSSSGCIVGIVIAAILGVIIIAGIITLALIGFNASKDTVDDGTSITFSDSFSDNDTDTEVATEKDDTPNPEYLAIFSENNIIDSPTLFIGLDVRTFASVDEDGMIEKMEFAYDGDVIKELVDTIYYPISEYSKEVVDVIDESMRESFASADALDYCTIEYKITDDYYITTIHSTQLDNVANLATLSAEEVLSYNGFAAFLSMEETANNLAAQGYIEK